MPQEPIDSHDYDKRLILKIVKEVEEGLPGKETIRMYELVKASLDTWLRN